MSRSCIDVRGRILLAGIFVWLGGMATASQARPAIADEVSFSEDYTNSRVILAKSQVSTRGTVYTAKPGGERDELSLTAAGEFEFRERRLPPAGRDALALRAGREFVTARLTTTVADFDSSAALPADRSLIVANGDREGVVSYSPSGALTREAADLLEVPGDPLALISLYPVTAVEIGADWEVSDWAAQMLTGVEAVESSKITCHLDQAHAKAAKVTFKGIVKGQRLGAPTTVEVNGAFIYDRELQLLTRAKAAYKVHSEIGAVNPGLDLTITSGLSREVAETTGGLTEDWLQSIPLEPTAENLELVFRAAPWGLELHHGRKWHLFQSVLEGEGAVTILRLIELGSLVAQCNFSPVPATQAGQITPRERFEADIRQSLGSRFRSVLDSQEMARPGGGKQIRVMIDGKVELAGEKEALSVPMTWIYYLVADPTGRQASFVFSVEPELLDQLKGQDQAIVGGLRFRSANR